MATSTGKQTIVAALIGNPNTGKSTLFNALCGMRQRVGNYPGVTVEKKVGRAQWNDCTFEIIDLPGSYSLAPQSPDEMVAVDVMLGRQTNTTRPDVIVCIVDSSNLERNLYLLSQVLELGIPIVVALNMMDIATEKGIKIDVDLLSQRLGVPIVPMQANRKFGLLELKSAMGRALDADVPKSFNPLPKSVRDEVSKLEEIHGNSSGRALPRFLIERLLLDVNGYLSNAGLPGVHDAFLNEIRLARQRLAKTGNTVPGVEPLARYEWISKTLDGLVQRPASQALSVTDRVDRVLTHRVWGSVFFAVTMLVLFQCVFYMAEPASMAIDYLNGLAASFVSANLAEGALESLLIDGVINGVGSVLVFLPQIFVLFLFIAVLEDCGYMARAAYLMDKLMSRIGLSGKSFIPLLSSFACAIPGIMATRVIENRRDRLITILIAPLMSCSARLPVYTLLIGAFIPSTTLLGGLLGLQGITMFAMYSIGMITAMFVAVVLRKTVIPGEAPAFVMELPGYKLPSVSVVLYRMLDRGWAFVRRAGTMIFAVTILVWAAAYYPRNADSLDASLVARSHEIQASIASIQSRSTDVAEPNNQAAVTDLESLQSELARVERHIQGAYLGQSFLGRLGRGIEPLVTPLGWDWRLGAAAIASFPAREVVIATLGVIYNLGDDADSDSLSDTLRAATWQGSDRPVFNIPVALSVMVFFALCAQCASTLVVMKRETNSWRWPVFAFIYMTTLAYTGALITYKIGMLFVD